MAAPSEIVPQNGLVYDSLKELQPVLCRPKLLPIKSYSLERLERLEKKMVQDVKQRREAEKAERGMAAWNTAPTDQQKLRQHGSSSPTLSSPLATPTVSAPPDEDSETHKRTAADAEADP